jgi:DNA modification methylase
MACLTQHITDNFALYNGDCCEVIKTLPDGSVDMAVYSPPFAELYNYSSDPADMSNCTSYEAFLEHYEFLVRELARVTKPGRINAVHCMDLLRGAHGWQRDFPGDIIRLYERHGFHYFSRHTIWKEPLRVAIRTRMAGLMHKTIVNDSSKCHAAGADFLIVFRRAGENAVPIAHPDGLSTYAGETPIPAELLAKYGGGCEDQRENALSHWIWRNYASSVWDDIRAGRLLPYREAKGDDEEKHICPLQLDVIERAVTLWSNPGEVVFTPFLGVGSEAFVAVKAGRKAVGIELKPSYYRQAVKNVGAALSQAFADEGSLFQAEPEPEAIDQ